MIREFHDEITRLREQLAKLSGGKLNGVTGSVGADGQPIVVEVEKYIYVEDKERMRKMEEQLEAEKMQIMKKFAKERQIIDAKVEIAEEDRKKLLEELEQKQAAAQADKSTQQKLLKKIKNMEEKLL